MPGEEEPAERALSPEQVAGREFSWVPGGYDPDEVMAYLDRLAGELAAARTRQEHLERLLKTTEGGGTGPDEALLVTTVGRETTELVREARRHAAAARSMGAELERIADEAGETRSHLEDPLPVAVPPETCPLPVPVENLAILRRAAVLEAELIRLRGQEQAGRVLDVAARRSRALVEEALEVRDRRMAAAWRGTSLLGLEVSDLATGAHRLLDAHRLVRRTLEETATELAAARDEVLASAAARGARRGRRAERPVGGGAASRPARAEGAVKTEPAQADPSPMVPPRPASRPASRAAPPTPGQGPVRPLQPLPEEERLPVRLARAARAARRARVGHMAGIGIAVSLLGLASVPPAVERPPPPRPAAFAADLIEPAVPSRETADQVQRYLDQGLSIPEVARRTGLSVAQVTALRDLEVGLIRALQINARSSPYLSQVLGSATHHEVPWPLLWSLIHAESSFDPRKVNLGGDVVGIAQIRLSQHPEITRQEASDPAEAIEFAARYLRERHSRYRDWSLAVLSYIHPKAADELFAPVASAPSPPGDLAARHPYVARVFGYAEKLGYKRP